jgi:hypothetical protein
MDINDTIIDKFGITRYTGIMYIVEYQSLWKYQSLFKCDRTFPIYEIKELEEFIQNTKKIVKITKVSYHTPSITLYDITINYTSSEYMEEYVKSVNNHILLTDFDKDLIRKFNDGG